MNTLYIIYESKKDAHFVNFLHAEIDGSSHPIRHFSFYTQFIENLKMVFMFQFTSVVGCAASSIGLATRRCSKAFSRK
jgi:hypothetical protein